MPMVKIASLDWGRLRGQTEMLDRTAPPMPLQGSPGFSLVEGLIAISLLAGLGLLLTSTFSFSLASQRIARLQMEASRSAGEILEILRSTSFDALDPVEDGSLEMDPLGQFQQLVLKDIQDRLDRSDLNVFLTIRQYQGRDEIRFMQVTVASAGISPHLTLQTAPPGSILVKQATLVTQRGINP
jgi:type II secretory pathway pseudopilin PulG